jgi:ParB/RepB/Spo0J family partition protein
MAKQTNGAQAKLHFATDDHVKKNGIFYVPCSLLETVEGFNDRQDYGTPEEMGELMESIYTQGPRVPLRGFKEGDKYKVIVGHRRKMAGDMAAKKYNVDILFPMLMYPPGTTNMDMLLDTLLTNDGKELTPLEKASVVSRLLQDKMPLKEIAAALGGVSETYVKRLQRFWEIPEAAKKLVRNNVVSATTIMGMLKNKNANIEEFIQEIEKQAGVEDGKPKKAGRKKSAKVTQKALKEKVNSWKEFIRFSKQHNSVFESKPKQEAFEFFSAVVKNQVTYSQILDFFTGK